jgi:cyclopropane fatty-acyl-phospholipid synthase-like methyltransferase
MPEVPDALLPEIRAALAQEQFPRSAAYDPRWIMENLMGPHVLWLAEALSQMLDLQPGMRVLDLGCGCAISSIFLAREFGLQVWATDLWIDAGENWQRILAAGAQDRVFPIHAEAHTLPFAEGFFDALVSMDAYHYFGTDDLYLDYVARFIRPGGQIGIVVPGVQQELAALPEHLAPYWEPDFWSFHSPDWWRRHWEKTGAVRMESADLVPHGWQHWLTWLEVCGRYGYPTSAREAEMVRVDAGRTLGFARVTARRL